MTEEGFAARLGELEADNARLRRLLDAQNAPGELRHRLRGTLALLRAIIQKSARSKEDVEAYAAHLEDRLDAIVRAQAATDDSGEASLAGIVSAELHQYGASEGDQVSLDGPRVLLQPRAAQTVTLAVHELAVNALQHGPLVEGRGRVDVAWRAEAKGEGEMLSISWKEAGPRPLPEVRTKGFGMTVLTEMLRYELQAVTQMDFEADGLRCSIAFPLPAKVGRVDRAPVGPGGAELRSPEL